MTLERIKEVHEFGNLIVKIILPEDIILLKCATEREKDRDVGEKMMEDRLKSEEIIKTTRFG